MDHEKHKSDERRKAALIRERLLDQPANTMPATFPVVGRAVRVVHECENMTCSFYYNKSRRPSVEYIKGVVANLEQAYERVVPESEKHRKYEVECCKSAASAAKFGHHLETWAY